MIVVGKKLKNLLRRITLKTEEPSRVACFQQFCKKPNKLAQNYRGVSFQWKHPFNCSQLGAIQRHFGHSEWPPLEVYIFRDAEEKQTSRITKTLNPVNETIRGFPSLNCKRKGRPNKQIFRPWASENIPQDWMNQKVCQWSTKIQGTFSLQECLQRIKLWPEE